eukprot:jgi/Mesvir1/23946/Mv10717-RA.1
MNGMQQGGARVSASTDSAKTSDKSSKLVTVSIDDLKSKTLKAIKSLGHSSEDSQILLDVMMYAQLRGNNQGIIKVVSNGVNRDPKARPIAVEHETRLSARLDGGGNPGMVVVHRAVELAVDKAARNGFGIVGTHGTCTSTGALGYYCNKIASRGLVALVLAQSPEFVAPYGAAQAIFGTNPIAFGIPKPQGGALVMDMATSAYTLFGLHEAKTAGRDIPYGVAQDASGAITTDPAAALNGGAIRVFDGSYKGSNLSLMVEILAGPLVGAAVADKLEERNWGNLVIVIDPDMLGIADFQQRVQRVLDRVKGAAKLPGVTEITLPGENGDRLARSYEAAGSLPVEAKMWTKIEEMAAAYDAAQASGLSSRAGAAGAGLKMSTRLVHPPDEILKDPYGATNPPLYQTATFAQPSATEFGDYDYTRSGNPTRAILEVQMAQLDGGVRGFAYASGMAALTAVTRLVKSGQTILAGDDIYGGTSRLLMRILPKQGIQVVNTDMSDTGAALRCLRELKDVRLVILESPTNPRLQITDIAAITKAAHEVGALVVVDNSVMAPVFQQPLALGADIVMTSSTKFISGQSDHTGGILTVRDPALADELYLHQNAEGSHLGPFDCWLALRGIKTMALRMEKQQANAQKMAEWLAAHPLVKRVNYPGLPSHPGYALHQRQATGAGSILSFTTDNLELSKHVVENTQLFKITVSFGNVTSLISLPCFMSHASIPAEVRKARGLPDDLVRISVGIEDAEDLLADLDAAFNGWAAAEGVDIAALRQAKGSLNGRIADLSNAPRDQLLARLAALEDFYEAHGKVR